MATNKEIILQHMVAQYQAYEAEYRYLIHQKQQPPEFRVIELEESELDDQINFILNHRDAFIETLKELGYEINSGE